MSRSARSSRAAWTATRTGPGPGTGVFVRRYSRHITIGAAGVTPADRTGSKKQKNEQIIMTARASVIHVIVKHFSQCHYDTDDCIADIPLA